MEEWRPPTDPPRRAEQWLMDPAFALTQTRPLRTNGETHTASSDTVQTATVAKSNLHHDKKKEAKKNNNPKTGKVWCF